MTTPIISIHDADGNETQRPMNDEEYAQFKIDADDAKAIEDAKEQAAIDKAALLDKLGINELDLKTLLS